MTSEPRLDAFSVKRVIALKSDGQGVRRCSILGEAGDDWVDDVGNTDGAAGHVGAGV